MKEIDYDKFKRNILSILSTQGMLLIINFLFSVLITRWLGPEERGQYSLATTVYSTGVQFGILGLHSAHVFYLSKDKKSIELVLGNSVVVSCIVGGLISVLIYGYVWINPEVLNLNNLFLVLSVVMIPIQLLWSFQGQTLITIGEVNCKNRLDLFNVIALLLLVIYFYMTNTLSAQSILLITLILTLSISVYSMWKMCYKNNVRPHFSISFLVSILPYGMMAHIACLLAYLVLRVDILMVSNMLGDKKTGIYSLGVSLSDLLTVISSSVTVLLFPVAAASDNEGEKIVFVKKTIFATTKVLVLCASLMVGAAFKGIPVLYGEVYKDAVLPFAILIPGVIAWGLESILGSYFSSINRFKYSIITMFSTLVINIVLNMILIPLYEIIGAAVASTTAYIIALVMMYIFFKRHERRIIHVQNN